MSREFITNIDDANAEIIRLDGEAAASAKTITARDAEITRLTGEVTRLQSEAAAAKTDADTKLAAEAAKVTQLTTDLNAAKTEATTAKAEAAKAIAQAGLKPQSVKGHPVPDAPQTSGATGIQRAIDARAKQVAANNGRVAMNG